MPPSRSLKSPVILAIAMLLSLAVLAIGWILLTVSGALADSGYAGLYWAVLTVGTVFMAFLVIGVVLYLVLTVKAINLGRRQSNFIDSVTHELKSPIAALKLYLQTLTSRDVSREQQMGFHRSMLEELDRLDRLVNQLLEAGRVESGAGDSDVTDVRLDDLLGECARAVCLDYQLPASSVTLAVEPFRVRGRQIDLEMIFRNIIDNAVKYAGDPPEVEITSRLRRDGRAIVRVADNGRRIPRQWRRKIFHRFVRLGRELEREKSGTGLGLYIVYTLVRRLHGRIRVEDRPGGSGTVFEIELPASPVAASSLEGVEPERVAEAIGETRKR